jgi:hypothetical protein
MAFLIADMDFNEESFVCFHFGDNSVHPKSCGDLRPKLDLSLVLLLSEVGRQSWGLLRFPEG